MNRQEKWNEYQLDAVAQLISGRTPEREQKEYYAAEGTPWVKIENLDQGFITQATEYLSPKGRDKVNLVPENSVLFSIVGTVGKVGIAGVELATNQQIVALIFDETKVLPLYGYYYLRHHADAIRKLSNQTTMALISRKILGQYRIQAPQSLEVQQKIVDKLTKFESYARKKERIRSQLDQYEKILFQKMFEQELKYHEKLTLKEFLRESIGTGIPKGEEPESEFPCVRSQDFEKTYLVRHEVEETTVFPNQKYMLCEGDVLIRNGKLLLVEQLKQPLYMERNILCLRTRNEQLLPEVLYGWLQIPEIYDSLFAIRKAEETRKRPIRGSELERKQIPYFSMDKQKEYAAFLKKIRQIQHALDKETEFAWKAWRSAANKYLQKCEEKKEISEKVSLKQETAEDEYLSEESFVHNSVEDAISHIILAVLCGWCPQDQRTGAYCQNRQQIFRKAQPFFQPLALSLVTKDGQKEYLLVRDFLTYHSDKICQDWDLPLQLLHHLLREREAGTILDAHLAFQGEQGICTENEWKEDMIKEMAHDGLLLLTLYSGFEDCSFLFEEWRSV